MNINYTSPNTPRGYLTDEDRAKLKEILSLLQTQLAKGSETVIINGENHTLSYFIAGLKSLVKLEVVGPNSIPTVSSLLKKSLSLEFPENAKKIA